MADKRGWIRKAFGAAPTESEARGEYETLKTKVLAQQKSVDIEKATVNPIKKAFAEAWSRVTNDSVEIPGEVLVRHEKAKAKDLDANIKFQEGIEAFNEGDGWPAKNEGTVTTRYVNGTVKLHIADKKFTGGLENLQQTKEGYTECTNALDLALRQNDKTLGRKLTASGLRIELTDKERILTGHAYVLNTDLAEFRKLKAEGDAGYNSGKKGFYGAAVKAYDEAKQKAESALVTATDREKTHNRVKPVAGRIEAAVIGIDKALNDKALAAEGLTPQAIGAMRPQVKVNPRTITGVLRRSLVDVSQKDGNEYAQAARDIETLGGEVDQIVAAIAELKELIAYRAEKKRTIRDEIRRVKADSAGLVAKLGSKEYEALEGPGSKPTVDDLTALNEFLADVEKSADIGFKILYSKGDIDKEFGDYHASIGLIEEGVQAIAAQARLVEEMQKNLVDEKREQHAVARFRELTAAIEPRLDQLQAWGWDPVVKVRGNFEKLLKAKPIDAVPSLEALATEVTAAHRDMEGKTSALIATADADLKAAEARYKAVYDTAHKTITWGRATANDALERLHKEINAARAAYAVDDPVSAQGISASLKDVMAELDAIDRAAKDPKTYKAVYDLHGEIADLIEAKPLSELLEEKSKELAATLKAKWAEAQTLLPDQATTRLTEFKADVEKAGTAAKDVETARREAKKKLKSYKAEFKTLKKSVKTATSGDKVITALKGRFETALGELDKICDQKSYAVGAQTTIELRVERATAARAALLKDGSTTEFDVDKAIASHREFEAEAEQTEQAMIAWERACGLFEVDLDNLTRLLKEQGDAVDAEVIAKTFESTKKMVKDSQQTEAGTLQLEALQRRVDELAKNPWALRETAMVAVSQVPAAWKKAVTETRNKLTEIVGALQSKAGDDDDIKQQTALVIARAQEVMQRFNPDAFNNHCLLLSNKQSDRKTRRKNKETALRQVATYRAFWDDPAVKRLMLNPFKIAPVFTEAYKALERIMFEFERYPD